MLRAALIGWLTVHVLALIAVLAISPFCWTLSLVYFRGAVFLESGVSSMVPWLSILVGAALLGIGGYVAATNTRFHKVGAGLLLSAAMAAYAVPLALLTDSSGVKDILDRFIWLLSIVVFPPVGALLARRWHRTDRPTRLLRRAPVLLAYASLPMGVFLPVAGGLALYCWSQVPRLASTPDTGDSLLLPSILVAVASLLLVAYSLIFFVKRRGWKKGIALNGYVYVVAIMAATLCFGFLRRDRENRLVQSLSETFDGEDIGEVDSTFVFPDPANPATLYIQASQSIPDENRPKGLSDPRPFTAKENPELAAWLSERSEALNMVLRVGDAPGTRFPHYAIKGVDWNLWSSLTGLVLTLAARARLAAGEGNVPEALLHLRPIIQMSAALSGQGEFHMIVGCRCRAIAVHVLREILRQPRLSREQSSLIAQKLHLWEATVLPDREHWSRTVRSKPPYLLEEVFLRLRTKSPWSYIDSQFLSNNAILEKRARVMDACLSKPSWRTMYEAFKAEAKRHVEFYGPLSAPLLGQSARGIEGLARADMDEMEAPIERLLSQVTRIRLLRTYAAVSLYRQRQGKLPAAWRDLVPTYLPAPLVDPFSGKALRLMPGDNGLCIYSVGDDGEDDGGRGYFSFEEAEREYGEGVAYRVADIVVVVPETRTEGKLPDE